MKTRMTLLALALFFASAACFAADNPQMGTWKLNKAKSKIPAGSPENSTVVYAADGDNIKITVDGTEADGKTGHYEWTGKFDGKDYAVTGDPTQDQRSYKKANARTLILTVKKDGKVTTSGRIVVSPDGKSRTYTDTHTDDKGKKSKSTAVYDKSQL